MPLEIMISKMMNQKSEEISLYNFDNQKTVKFIQSYDTSLSNTFIYSRTSFRIYFQIKHPDPLSSMVNIEFFKSNFYIFNTLVQPLKIVKETLLHAHNYKIFYGARSFFVCYERENRYGYNISIKFSYNI